MATYVKIKIRRDTTANWTAVNPVLDLGEIGADMTQHRLKVGDGLTAWNNLPFCDPELVNNLMTGGIDKALTAEQGMLLNNMKANRTELNTLENNLQTQIDTKVDNTTLDNSIENLRNELTTLISSSSGGGPSVINKLDSDSISDALSAKQGKVLKGLVDGKALQSDLDTLSNKVDNIGLFGMGYQIVDWNDQDKPTKIIFDDGVVCDLVYYPGNISVNQIIASTGEVMEILYDNDYRITGRKITR